MQGTPIYSIGHSTHSYEQFLALLRANGVSAIADVRTSPYSRYSPHFGREALKSDLQADGIAYSFLGEELGGRPSGSRYYCEGVADYERMAEAPAFTRGIERVLAGAKRFRIALMCSEQDPLDCHRCLLVGRELTGRGAVVRHILSDGTVAEQGEIEETLLLSEGQHAEDLFLSRDERVAGAYRKRARKVAYAEQPDGAPVHAAAE